MPNEQMPVAKTPTDVKHVMLVLLVLAAVVISSVNLALSLSKDQETSATNTESEALLTNSLADEPATEEPEYASLLEKKQYYSLPFGAAEVEAYYTKIEKATTLDDSGPTVTCSALVVADGPKMLMDSLKEARFGTPPTVVIGSEDSNWTGVNESTKANPVKLLVTLGSMFEGEAVGCMSVVFDSFTTIE
jgi:hypothetical protein